MSSSPERIRVPGRRLTVDEVGDVAAPKTGGPTLEITGRSFTSSRRPLLGRRTTSKSWFGLWLRTEPTFGSGVIEGGLTGMSGSG
jgi:hypothetical protein